MVGIVGSNSGRDPVARMTEAINREEWYESETVSNERWNLAIVHHGRKDPNGKHIWDGEQIGILHGYVTNVHSLPFDWVELPKRILNSPIKTLKRLDGSFVLACAGTNCLVLAMDRLGTKPLYFHKSDSVEFCSSVHPLAPSLNEATINTDAISELITFGYVQGNQTLVDQITALPPATVLEVDGTDIEITRYEQFTFRESSTSVRQISATYRDSIERVSQSIPAQKRAGLPLSGGLDSRLASGYLQETVESFEAVTYDANPGGGKNVNIAQRVSDIVNAKHTVMNVTPDEFVNALDEGIRLTDGRIRLTNLHGLPWVINNLHEHVDILITPFGQGELFGDDVFPVSFDTRNVTEILYSALAGIPATEAARFFTNDTSPRRGLERVVASSAFSVPERIFIDSLLRTYFPNLHYRARMWESQASVRTPIADRTLLAEAVNIRPEQRRGRSSITFGRFPQATPPIKLELIRRCSDDLAAVPYERTGVAPKYPMSLHTLRWVLGDQLPSYVRQIVPGVRPSPPLYREWYHENGTFQSIIDSLMESAKTRDFFDSKAITEIHDACREGDPGVFWTIAGIATAESWLMTSFETATTR